MPEVEIIVISGFWLYPIKLQHSIFGYIFRILLDDDKHIGIFWTKINIMVLLQQVLIGKDVILVAMLMFDY